MGFYLDSLWIFQIGGGGGGFLEVQICKADVKTSDIMFILSSLFCFCSLKLECEKLASEKTEMQRHYVMVGIKDEKFSF